MKPKDLKKNCYIKWVADRMFKSWNTYGKVLSIKKDEVIIITFDDFKETLISLTGEAIKDEITLCSQNDVADYIQERMLKLNTKKLENEFTFKKEQNLIDSQLETLSKYSL